MNTYGYTHMYTIYVKFKYFVKYMYTIATCPSYSKLALYEAACNHIMLVCYAAVNIIIHTAM